eukprot:144727-Rhodomonas_salina.4
MMARGVTLRKSESQPAATPGQPGASGFFEPESLVRAESTGIVAGPGPRPGPGCPAPSDQPHCQAASG